MDRRRVNRLFRSKLREVGRRYEESRRNYAEGRESVANEPTEDMDIVCRRHAEKRTVTVDAEGRPHCYDAGHSDCEGCVEDLENGTIETW